MVCVRTKPTIFRRRPRAYKGKKNYTDKMRFPRDENDEKTKFTLTRRIGKQVACAYILMAISLYILLQYNICVPVSRSSLYAYYIYIYMSLLVWCRGGDFPRAVRNWAFKFTNFVRNRAGFRSVYDRRHEMKCKHLFIFFFFFWLTDSRDFWFCEPVCTISTGC